MLGPISYVKLLLADERIDTTVKNNRNETPAQIEPHKLGVEECIALVKKHQEALSQRNMSVAASLSC